MNTTKRLERLLLAGVVLIALAEAICYTVGQVQQALPVFVQ